jgi:hypothetical protein
MVDVIHQQNLQEERSNRAASSSVMRAGITIGKRL